MLIAVLVVLGVVLLVAIFMFNRLIADRNQMRAAWSDIDVQLMRRHDPDPQRSVR
jgi:LemA protein